MLFSFFSFSFQSGFSSMVLLKGSSYVLQKGEDKYLFSFNNSNVTAFLPNNINFSINSNVFYTLLADSITIHVYQTTLLSLFIIETVNCPIVFSIVSFNYIHFEIFTETNIRACFIFYVPDVIYQLHSTCDTRSEYSTCSFQTDLSDNLNPILYYDNNTIHSTFKSGFLMQIIPYSNSPISVNSNVTAIKHFSKQDLCVVSESPIVNMSGIFNVPSGIRIYFTCVQIHENLVDAIGLVLIMFALVILSVLIVKLCRPQIIQLEMKKVESNPFVPLQAERRRGADDGDLTPIIRQNII